MLSNVGFVTFSVLLFDRSSYWIQFDRQRFTELQEFDISFRNNELHGRGAYSFEETKQFGVSEC